MSVGVSMKRSKPWTDRAWLYHEYHELKKSQKEIAGENDTAISTISRWMKHHGIEIRSVSQTASENQKKFWSNEENKEKYLRGDKNPARRESVRKKLSEVVHGHWERDETRKTQMSERSKSFWNDKRREHQSARMKELNVVNWSDEEYRKKMSDVSLRTWRDPTYLESAAKIVDALKKVWDNPNFKERASDRARESSIKRLERIGVSFPSYNPASIAFIENFAAGLNEHVQHAENGGELRVSGYWLDGYIPVKNIAIEYDESHHFKKSGELSERDVRRMKRIHKEIGCTFVRIKHNGAITIYDETWFLAQEK
jgi:hypothetical protein